MSKQPDFHAYKVALREKSLPVDAQWELLEDQWRDMFRAKKDHNHDTYVSKEESEIDLIVYHLYGLTYDEVLIVDPDTPITREEYENQK